MEDTEPVLFSGHFQIKRIKSDDWFDPILDDDTKAFVDPFLIFKEQLGVWADAHSRIIDHFNLCFRLIAEGHLNPDSVKYQKAVDLLAFPEPKELCLGYTRRGTDGAGSARGFASIVARLIADSIRRGMENIDHFEELGIFEKGIGADRISDMAATILKPRLIEYTRSVVAAHDIPTDRHVVRSGDYDDRRLRWSAARADLPTNPFTHGPILLVPERFLNRLPTINKDDWWDAYENERLRADINYEVLGNVDKETIVRAARSDPEFVREWTTQREREPAGSYNLSNDPEGVYQWDPVSREYVSENPISLPEAQSEEEFFEVIEKVIQQFKLFVEEQGGWDLLWNGTKEKHEHAVQLLFRGIAKHYCEANGVSLDPEVNLGRGPVDFKFSNGYERRVHLEIKKVHSGQFWHGLEEQLPSYMVSDEVNDGWFMAVQYRDTRGQRERILELPNMVYRVASRHGKNLRYVLVDARPKPSASVA
jgi:hypothetical protein